MTAIEEIEEELVQARNFVSDQHLFFCMDALLPVMIRPYPARMMLHCPHLPDNRRETSTLQRGSTFVDEAGEVIGTCLRDTQLWPFRLDMQWCSSDPTICEIVFHRPHSDSANRVFPSSGIPLHFYGARSWEWYELLYQQGRVESCVWSSGNQVVSNHQVCLDFSMPGGNSGEHTLMPWGCRNSWERLSDFFLLPEAFCSFRIEGLKESLCPDWDTLKVRMRCFSSVNFKQSLSGDIPLTLSMVPVGELRKAPMQPLQLREGSTRLPLQSESPQWNVVAVEQLYWRKQEQILPMDNDIPWGNKSRARWSLYHRQGQPWIQLSPREGVFRRGEFITGSVWELPRVQDNPSVPSQTKVQQKSTSWHINNMRWQPISTLRSEVEAMPLRDYHQLWEVWQKTGDLENSVELWPAWFAYLGRNHPVSRIISGVSLNTGLAMHRGQVRHWRRYRCEVDATVISSGMLFCFAAVLFRLLCDRASPGELIHLSLKSTTGETLWENGHKIEDSMSSKLEAGMKQKFTIAGNQ